MRSRSRVLARAGALLWSRARAGGRRGGTRARSTGLRQTSRATGPPTRSGITAVEASRRHRSRGKGRPKPAPALAGTSSARPPTACRRASRWRRGCRQDPVAAAQAYIAENRDLLGLTESGAATSSFWPSPHGQGRGSRLPAALRRQLPASTACSPSASETARPTTSARRWPGAAAPAPATSAPQAAADRDQRLRSRRRHGDEDRARRGAHPRGARAAYLVTLGADVSGADGSPVAYATYVDARDGRSCCARTWSTTTATTRSGTAFPNTPPPTTPPPTPGFDWCPPPPPDATRCRHAGVTAGLGHRPGYRPPTFTTNGNNAFAVHNWFSNNPFTRGHRAGHRQPDRATTPIPGPTSGSSSVQPGHHLHLGAVQRHRRGPGEPVRHAQP